MPQPLSAAAAGDREGSRRAVMRRRGEPARAAVPELVYDALRRRHQRRVPRLLHARPGDPRKLAVDGSKIGCPVFDKVQWIQLYMMRIAPFELESFLLTREHNAHCNLVRFQSSHPLARR